MEPKFQSSFIPKGPTSSTVTGATMARRAEGKGFLHFVSVVIFTISVVLALGVFGYKFYLKYSIDKMGTDLEEARATLQPETITELTRLNDRIISVKELIAKHSVLTPLFEFLELSTPETVRFNNFGYSMVEEGLKLSMTGEARGYAALALLSDIFSKSQYLKGPIFSGLNLNEKGNVSFIFSAIVNPSLVSYEREVERIDIPVAPSEESPETATSTPN